MKEGKKRLNRRDFFAKSVRGAAAFGILGVSGWGRAAAPTTTQKAAQAAKKNIICRGLGTTGLRLPIVNMGVMNSLNPELVKRSYEIGIRHFDTAAYYMRGQNEVMVGKAIQELGVRDNVIIGTKVFVAHEQRPRMSHQELKSVFLNTAEESLKRLQTDSIDIFYVHNVQDIGYLNNPGIKEALAELKEQGKARHIGFSVHTNMIPLLLDAVQSGFYEVIAVAFNYAMANDQDLFEALKSARAKGIGLIAMKTQCAQYWYREYVPSDKQKFYEESILHKAVLKWALRHDFITCAVPGYTTFNQMEEDFSVAYDLEYTPEERKFLEDRGVKLAMQSYCRQCYRCQPSCPHGVDVPTLMRTHMYAACYGNFYAAREALESIREAKGLSVCQSCRTCLAQCVRRINIPERLQELKLIYA